MRALTITTQAAWPRAISCAARRGRTRKSERFRRYAAPAAPVSLAVIVPLAVVALVASSDVAVAANASAVPVVHARGSDLQAGGQRWIGFGANYSEVGHDTPVRRAFATAERLGFNQLRVYLPLFSYLRRSDGAVRQRPLRRLQQVLAIAEHDGIYLDLTGDLTWYPQRVPAWYDDASTAERWRLQARFWRAIGGAAEPANNVLDYELTSEPQAGDSPSWYGGPLGDAYFCPYVVRDLAGRPADEWAREWTRTMAAALRSQDQRHMVTIGLLPDTSGPFRPANVGRYLDVLTVHEYPQRGEAANAVAMMQAFAASGKPLILGETHIFADDPDTQRAFLLDARPYLDGFMDFFDGRPPAQMPTSTIAEAMHRESLELFLALRASLLAQ